MGRGGWMVDGSRSAASRVVSRVLAMCARLDGWWPEITTDAKKERGTCHANASHANQPAERKTKKNSGSVSDSLVYTHTPFRGRRRLGLCVRSPPSASPARAPACERKVGSEWCLGRQEARGRDTARGGHTHAHTRTHTAQLSGTCPPQTWIREKGR